MNNKILSEIFINLETLTESELSYLLEYTVERLNVLKERRTKQCQQQHAQ